MKTLWIRTLALSFITAAAAFSGTLVVTGINGSFGLGTIAGSNLWMQESGTNLNIGWAGVINVTVDGVPKSVFCADAFTDIYLGSTNSTTVTAPSTTALQRAAWVLNTEWGMLNAPPSGVTMNQIGGAIQLAIWDIMNDGGNGFTAGNIQKSSDPAHPTDAKTLQYAQQFLADSVGKLSTTADVYTNVCVSGAPVCNVPSQTLIGLAGNTGILSVPEPASLSLLLLGGLGALLARRGC
jgi:hypothetical protein